MSRDHFNLDGRIALVAGASRGIGEAIARRLAEYGAHVLVTSRRIEGCQAVAESIRAAGGKADPGPVQDHGFMYGRSFEDPDGHIWEIFWMDMEAAKAAMASAS